MAIIRLENIRTATKTWRWTSWTIYIHELLNSQKSYFTQTIQSKSQTFCYWIWIELARTKRYDFDHLNQLRKLTSTTSQNTIANGWHNDKTIDLLNTQYYANWSPILSERVVLTNDSIKNKSYEYWFGHK
jgi:hypothetical protein